MANLLLHVLDRREQFASHCLSFFRKQIRLERARNLVSKGIFPTRNCLSSKSLLRRAFLSLYYDIIDGKNLLIETVTFI